MALRAVQHVLVSGDRRVAVHRTATRAGWLASAGIVFALSIDDFVITQYLAGGADTNTVSMLLYSTARGAPTPALNALATITLVLTLVTLGLAYLVYRKFAGAGSAAEAATLGEM